eukprot:319310-Amphidinium_carterae.1
MTENWLSMYEWTEKLSARVLTAVLLHVTEVMLAWAATSHDYRRGLTNHYEGLACENPRLGQTQTPKISKESQKNVQIVRNMSKIVL